ncbi:MAG: cobalamin biosynthesis protein [Paracoccaceae bacterium]
MKIAGIGFRTGAPLASLRDALAQVEALGGIADALATPQSKADDPPLRALAAERGLRVFAVRVAGILTPTQSARVLALHGTGSVAEAAALAAAGPVAKITVARVVASDAMATCAMAECEGTRE